jgi:hypothetical protein
VKALVQLATNSEHRKKFKHSDQVVFDQVGVEAMAVWFKFYCTETIENGTRISRWTPGLEAPVGNVRKPSTTDTPREKPKEAGKDEAKHFGEASTKTGSFIWRESGQATEIMQGGSSGSNNQRSSEAERLEGKKDTMRWKAQPPPSKLPLPQAPPPVPPPVPPRAPPTVPPSERSDRQDRLAAIKERITKKDTKQEGAEAKRLRSPEERITKKDTKQEGAEAKRLRSPEVRLVPREGITALDEVATHRASRREATDFVDAYMGSHDLTAGVRTVFCNRCGVCSHYSELREGCRVAGSTLPSRHLRARPS